MLLIAPLLLSTCIEDSPSTNTRSALTQRQRDSLTATLPLPGARVVGSPLNAADAASSRAAQIDAANQ
ncbi:MAG: hypothetical protein H0T48_00975 [Gemmatimonadaceae bacterium]|nr:hypothetical protein [Gemmatimonadaceae bacterium]